MSPSERDYVLLSRQAYEHGGGVAPEGWEIVKSSAEDGFYATAYLNKKTDQVVIAYRGTEPNEFDHILNDLQILFKKSPYLEQKAIAFSESVLSILKARQHNESYVGVSLWDRFNVSYTGHSLGGVLAQLTALQQNRKFVVFESPGVECLVKNTPEKYHLDNVKGNIINTYPNVINSVTRHILTPKYVKIKSAQEIAAQRACELAQTCDDVTKIQTADESTQTCDDAAETQEESSKSKSASDLESIILSINAKIQTLLLKLNNMSSDQQSDLARTGGGLIVMMLKWLFTGLLQQREGLIETANRLMSLGSSLGHLHSIDNIVSAYEDHNGKPPILDVDPAISDNISNLVAGLCGDDVCSWKLSSHAFEDLVNGLHDSSDVSRTDACDCPPMLGA